MSDPVVNRRLLVMAGGTGGHVFPGIAVAEYLQQEGWQVEWLGTKDRMEAQLVPKHGFKIHFIDIAGVRGNGLIRLLKAPFMIFHAIWQARRVIKAFQPHLVLGMGGYASGPGGVAAWLTGVPLILHEQNAVPGMTNKLLAPLARRVLTAFKTDSWKLKGVKKLQVGNPVRSAFSLVHEKEHIGTPLKILISGGSLGARVLNQKVPETIGQLFQEKALKTAVQVWHQCGKGNSETVSVAYEQAGVNAQFYKVDDFIDDMVAAYEWADIVICRAGALTVSEVALAGRCAIFVPLPHAVDDHQTKNAHYLVKENAAYCLPQTELENGKLIPLLKSLAQELHKVTIMSIKARQLGEAKATESVVNICIEEASVEV